jgi:hypothetical protein
MVRRQRPEYRWRVASRPLVVPKLSTGHTVTATNRTRQVGESVAHRFLGQQTLATSANEEPGPFVSG